MRDDIQLPNPPNTCVLTRVMPDDYRYGDVRGYTLRQMRRYAHAAVLADRERRAQPAPGAKPVAWLVGQESLRGTIPNWMVFLTHSVLLHTREPQTTNPVWPLYAHPPAQDEAVMLLADIKAWDLQYLALPLDLRRRIQVAIDAAIAQRGEVRE